MADSLTYREKLDADRIIQIRAIARDLPQACGDFLRAIAVTTGTFTRLAYAIDLKTCVEMRLSQGGPSPKSVQAQIDSIKNFLAEKE